MVALRRSVRLRPWGWAEWANWAMATVIAGAVIFAVTIWLGINVAFPRCHEVLTSRQERDLGLVLGAILTTCYTAGSLIRPRVRSLVGTTLATVYPLWMALGLAEGWRQVVGPGTFCF